MSGKKISTPTPIMDPIMPVDVIRATFEREVGLREKNAETVA